MTISEMNCDRFDALLSDYLEGTLDASARDAVERHMKECVRCTGLVRDLERIQSEAAALPDLVPSRDLWTDIEARIAAPVIPLVRTEKSRRFAPWMAAAAAALVVSTAGITYVLTATSLRHTAVSQVATAQGRNDLAPASSAAGDSQPQRADDEAVNVPSPAVERGRRSDRAGTSSVPRSVGAVTAPSTSRVPGAQLATRQRDVGAPGTDEVYGKEIDMLQKIVSDRKTQLDSSTVAIIERNLRIIDAAIAQSKAALARDPASLMLNQQLTRALDKKVELLRTAALLPAST